MGDVIDDGVRWVGNCRVKTRRASDPLFQIVALPDLCCPAEDQFQGFVGYCQATKAIPEMIRATWHFIDFPGQAPGSSTLSYWPSFGSVVENVAAAAKEACDPSLQVVGFAAGIGADVIRRLADADPKLFRGFVLVGPIIDAPGPLWSVGNQLAAYFVYYFGWTTLAIDVVLRRWFTDDTIEQNLDMRERFASSIQSINNKNAARIIFAMSKRPAFTSDVLSRRRYRATIACGRDSATHADAVDALQMFYGGMATIIEPFSRGSLVTEEDPQSISMALSLFLKSTVAS